jgi:hypothetical protein
MGLEGAAMSGRNWKRALATACALGCLAAGASAQQWAVGFHKKLGKQSAISVSVGPGAGYHHRHPYGGSHAPVFAPKPVITHAPHRVWVPGHFTSVRQRTYVPGYTENVWVPAKYATHYDPFGTPYQVLVQPGHYQTVHHPGHYQVKPVQVWKPGHWKTVYK